jgi:ATP-dependent DNA helicase HFM1/MER3
MEPDNNKSSLCFTDASIVVSAPTGSGKTVIFELAIIRLLVKLEDMEFTGEYKIVYSK